MPGEKKEKNLLGKSYRKSNILISAKYQSTLLENRLLAAALAKIQEADVEPDGSLILSMSAAELKAVFNDKNGSLYHHLRPTAERMTGRKVGMQNDKREEFHYSVIVTDADYVNGVFTIRFNSRLREQLVNIENKFTLLQISTLMKFSSVYAFRLYEILKSEAFQGNHYVQQTLDGGYEFELGLAELKLEMGVIDASDRKVEEILKESRQRPDYERAVKAAAVQKFKEWSDFKKRVLDVAIREINEKSDMKISYDTLKEGRGGKVTKVSFLIHYKDKTSKKPVLQKKDNIIEIKEPKGEELYDMIDQVNSFMTEKLPTRDIIAILKAGGYNLEKVKKQYDNACMSGTIQNLTGWMIKALKEDYSAPVEKKNTKKKENSFQDFSQRDTDYDKFVSGRKSTARKKYSKDI